jgi:hypothetical protein
MSVLPYAAVRRMARHTWFHDPEFPSVHLADLGLRRPRRSTPTTTPGVSGSRPACAGAAGHAPTIRLAARPNLGRLSRAHDIGDFRFPPPRRRNCARPGLSGRMRGSSGFAARRRGVAPPCSGGRLVPGQISAGWGRRTVGPGTLVAERGLPAARGCGRAQWPAGRPGLQPSSCGLPGLACGGSWGPGVVQLVWRGGWRVGRGNGAAEPGGVGQVEPAGGDCRA